MERGFIHISLGEEEEEEEEEGEEEEVPRSLGPYLDDSQQQT